MAAHLNDVVEDVLVWIDTAFDGHLVFSKALIRKLNLEPLVETEAILADGSKIAMESYFCDVHIRYDMKTVVIT